MDEAIFYPNKGKILINAYFYSFWISQEEFKKYNLEYKIVDNNLIDNNYDKKSSKTDLTELEKRTRKIKI